jgi:DNA polymerase III delta prime subunit
MAESETRTNHNVIDSQVGILGDHAHIEGGIHFHPASPPANPTERRNRAAMLQLVRNTWVVGVLEQSLHGAAMLELGKDYTPEAVERPWDLELHLPGQERRPVPHGAPIRDLFDECSGALLILGEPGSGKTTTLLELARDLIARAETDETRHIPVVLNLSSWAAKQQPLEDWLFEELTTKYHIPKRIARPWIENDTLLLLLDGLDEVKADARDKCVAAINAFRQEHLVPLAVCSRTADYEPLTARLHLQGAIRLRPLTPAQIDAYLAGAGTELQAVRATLQHDPVLQEMAESPLMLSIMTLAYSGLAVANLQTLATPEARRQHLFDTYVERMFERRTKEQPYAQEQTLHWLTWLAGQMTEQKQTVFLIENLQPTWLPAHECRRTRRLAVGSGDGA